MTVDNEQAFQQMMISHDLSIKHFRETDDLTNIGEFCYQTWWKIGNWTMKTGGTLGIDPTEKCCIEVAKNGDLIGLWSCKVK